MIPYLKAMGIEVWHWRKSTDPMPESSLSGYFYELSNVSSEVKTIFIAKATADITQRNAEQALLVAMAKAMKLSAMGQWYSILPSMSDLPLQMTKIIFGEPLARALSLFANGKDCFVSYSPAELLANPSLKHITWKTLQQAMTQQ